MILEGWSREPFTAKGYTHDVYWKGVGPGILVMHEMPGLTAGAVAYAQTLVDDGYMVAMPHLFGKVDVKHDSKSEFLKTYLGTCVSREFHSFAVGSNGPVTEYLKALAHELHERAGGAGVGCVGMCYTGGYGLAMMLDPVIVAPVLSQPSTPAPISSKRKSALGLTEDETEQLVARASAGCAVLGLRFTNDGLAPLERFETLERLLGDNFIGVQITSPDEANGIPADAHSVLTTHHVAEVGNPTHDAFWAVRDFFTERLKPYL